jgi:hypothetical protein
MVAELRSTSPRSVNLEPSIPVGEVAIEGLAIDGYRLRVIFDPSPYNQHDTHAKILRSARRSTFVRQYGRQLLMGRGRTLRNRRQIHATLATRVEWEGDRNPRAEIVGNHIVVVKDFGRIFLGEILISSGARRITVMRVELGSDGGGQAGGPDVDTNGGWSP